MLLLHASSWFPLRQKRSCNIKLHHYNNRYTAWYSSLLTWTMEFNRRKRQFLCNILVLHFFGIINLKCSVILLHQHFSTYIVQCANHWAVLQWQSCPSRFVRHALHNKWYKPSEMPRWYPLHSPKLSAGFIQKLVTIFQGLFEDHTGFSRTTY